MPHWPEALGILRGLRPCEGCSERHFFTAHCTRTKKCGVPVSPYIRVRRSYRGCIHLNSLAVVLRAGSAPAKQKIITQALLAHERGDGTNRNSITICHKIPLHTSTLVDEGKKFWIILAVQAKARTVALVGRWEKSLLGDPGSELCLGRAGERKSAKTI